MNDDAMKAAARNGVAELVQRFHKNESDYLRNSYNETQARSEFITPLLEALGWDVHNNAAMPLAFRDVIEEATVEVGVEGLSKRPDYELRLARQRKLFVEAKKPYVRVDRNQAAAFQARRYGYSASLPVSVLTTFNQLAIYDCRSAPLETDQASVARVMLINYQQFETHFDELWSLLSRHAVYSGEFDRRFAVEIVAHGAEPFDHLFLRQVRSWRARLAADIHANTPGLTAHQLTYGVQLFLSRLIFLRVCEDREIERYETLKALPANDTYAAFMGELRRADDFYNSGLFDMLDDTRLGIKISDHVLHGIITELYYPRSPYTYVVIQTEVLGEIYEQFLGEEIAITGTNVSIVSKPEVRESGGVFPTPQYIVDAIVQRTLLPALAVRSPADLADFTVADMCCGSGVFLLSCYEFIMDYYLSWYLAADREQHAGRTIYEVAGGQWRLTFEEKRRILLAHIRGIDIDSNAADVARFSLLLKLVENETSEALRDFVKNRGISALPALDETIRSGNSLVSVGEWSKAFGAMEPRMMEAVNPFTWSTEFPAEMQRGGFDVIVGNPPYIRIQNMVAYSPREAEYYQNVASPYVTARQDNFDKYSLFIERFLKLLRPNGRCGTIVPHKFMITQAGESLRTLLAADQIIETIVHFGAQPVFGSKIANYTCILVFDRGGCPIVHFERVTSLAEWRYGKSGNIVELQAGGLNGDKWQFANEETVSLFARIRTAFPKSLGDVAEIFVGVQTSADSIFIFREVAEAKSTVSLRWNDKDWPIEREILRPCLLDVIVYQFAQPQPNTWMIFPYEVVTEAGRSKARLYQPPEMTRRFPLCEAYLKARRGELEHRNITGGADGQQQFYQFGRSQSLTKFDSPKILFPILSVEARYGYDDNNVIVTGGGNGPYYMLRPRYGAKVSINYLMAILNNSLSEAVVRTNTSLFRGGYYSHGKQFIENLPIPMPSDKDRIAIEMSVQHMSDALAAGDAARTPAEIARWRRTAEALRIQIDAQVCAVFELSSAEGEIVRAVPVPS
jgi:hypothetical protein